MLYLAFAVMQISVIERGIPFGLLSSRMVTFRVSELYNLVILLLFFQSKPPDHLIGCVHLGTHGVHGRPLLQTPRFLLLRSAGLPLNTENEEDMSKNEFDERGEQTASKIRNIG